MYKVQFQGKTFEIQPGDEGMSVDGSPLVWDLVTVGDGLYHIRYKNKGYAAQLVKIDKESKTVEIKVQGQSYSIRLQDGVDVLMEKMGMNASATGKVNVIKAPMPGLIIDLRVKAGDSVKAGDPLLILEAMKMENIIKAPGEGTVKRLRIKKGDSVEKGQVMIEF